MKLYKNLIHIDIKTSLLIQIMFQVKRGDISWPNFLSRYRKTIKRIMRIRGMPKAEFDFVPSEALDFFYKEKSIY